MTSVVLAIHDNTVHQRDPLMRLLKHRKLWLIEHFGPVGIRLSNGEDTAVRNAQVGTSEQEGDVRRDVGVCAEKVVHDRVAVEIGSVQLVVDAGNGVAEVGGL